MLPKKRWLASRDRKVLRGRIHQLDQFLIAPRKELNVISILWRLGAHQTVAVTAFCDKQRMMTLLRSIKRPHKTMLSLQHHDIFITEVIGLS